MYKYQIKLLRENLCSLCLCGSKSQKQKIPMRITPGFSLFQNRLRMFMHFISEYYFIIKYIYE
jgi:hypothetical protein